MNVNNLFDNYEVQSTQIGITDSVIWIDVYDKNDIPLVEKCLKVKLSKDDLKQYEIDVFLVGREFRDDNTTDSQYALYNRRTYISLFEVKHPLAL